MGKLYCLNVAIFTYDVLRRSHLGYRSKVCGHLYSPLYAQWMQILPLEEWGHLKSNCVQCVMQQWKLRCINL